MNPRIKNIVKWTLVGGVVFVALNLAYTFLYLADLQPESLRAGISGAQKARGRALLTRLAQVHGATAYQQHETITFKGTDRWFGAMGAVVNPFPLASQSFVVDAVLRSRSARFRLTNGARSGDLWGFRERDLYHQPKGGKLEFQPDDDLSAMTPASFLIPTYRYFVEFPFQIQTGEIVAALEPKAHEGRTFDRVYVTWGDAKAHRKSDQYIVWLDQQTGRLARLEYTIRDFASSAVGVAEYASFQSVGGILLPKRISVGVVLPTGGSLAVHEIVVNEASFDAVKRQLLERVQLPKK